MRLSRSKAEDLIIEEINRNQAPFALERALLMLSGLKSEQEIESYQRKIDQIHGRFRSNCERHHPLGPSSPPLYRHRPIALCLFEYLWNSKPQRFGDKFQLTDVIDAQLQPGARHPVGTCIGLTSLYSVLGLRTGLRLSLLVASGHVLNRLRVEEHSIDIDHTDPQGFDCRAGDQFIEFPLPVLTANVFNSRGLLNERKGRFAAAKADYQKAIRVNPSYANAFNNRGNMRFREGRLEAAVADYSEAIRINSRFYEAYCNRGMAQQKLGRHAAAQTDFRAAIEINPDYSDAQLYLQLYNDIPGQKPIS